MRPHGEPHATSNDRRVPCDEPRTPRVSRVTSLAIAIPIALALGIAGLATFLVGVTALLVGPRLRERTARTDRRRTITLDRSDYRTVERQGTEGQGNRTLTIAMTPRHPGSRA